MKRGNVTPLYPSQQQRARVLVERIGVSRILMHELLSSWRRQQLLEHARRQSSRSRAS